MTNKNNRGYFWIENESSKRTGTLTISEDHKVTVHVDGVLFNGELKSLQLSHDELNGYLFSSEYVKILDPYSLRGFGPREEDSHEIYFGSEYIKSNNDISEPQTYSRIRWKLTGLDRWLNISTYNLKKQNELNTFEIEYASDLSELNWETNTGTINILFEYNIHTNEDNLIFENEFFLEIVFNENKTIKECFELSRIVERFFVTFVSRKHLVSYPSIYNEKNSESVIYYQTYNYDKGPGSEWLSSSFALIKNRFGYYLSNYIEMTPKYLAGFFGYPSSLSKGLFIQNKFSHLVTGLEVIHIQHYGLQKSPENKNDEILEFKSKIKECTKFRSDERRALRKSFEKKYEYNLRERLYDIISNFDFLDRETASLIILDIVDIRNEIMHYGGIKNNNSRFSDSIIIKFIGILEMLSVISVMFVSGVEKEIIQKIYMESSFYYYPRNLYEGYKRNKV